jgi:hypothetical protein
MMSELELTRDTPRGRLSSQAVPMDTQSAGGASAPAAQRLPGLHSTSLGPRSTSLGPRSTATKRPAEHEQAAASAKRVAPPADKPTNAGAAGSRFHAAGISASRPNVAVAVAVAVPSPAAAAVGVLPPQVQRRKTVANRDIRVGHGATENGP